MSDDLTTRVRKALCEVIDPELGLSVIDLGLVYGVELDGDRVQIQLTMTTPSCPLGDEIVRDAEMRLAALDGVGTVLVELVWDPPWSPARMTPSAREALGWHM